MLDFTDVGFSYGDRPLFEGLSLSLPAGSFHFLTGPSGTGKTTFLKLCYLELAPAKGRVRVLGEEGGKLDRDAVARLRQRIGIVHQDCQFLDHMTVSENVALPLFVAGRPLERERENLADLLGWVGLAGHVEARPPELSGGERQRAALARAVIMSPDVILADEPTGNVDWEMSTRILSLLVQLNRMGKTILIATHDLNLIRQAKAQVQARVLRIRGGGIEAGGADL